MSVPVSKRTLSDLEFYRNAVKLRQSVTYLCLFDFGIKRMAREPHWLAMRARMDEEDRAMFEDICKRNGISSIEETWPAWFSDRFRKYVLDTLEQLFVHINNANAIYPTTIHECDARRDAQNTAIADCKHLEELLQWLMSVLPVDANRYERLVKQTEYEIKLIRGWRKSDNKIRKRLAAGES